MGVFLSCVSACDLFSFDGGRLAERPVHTCLAGVSSRSAGRPPSVSRSFFTATPSPWSESVLFLSCVSACDLFSFDGGRLAERLFTRVLQV